MQDEYPYKYLVSYSGVVTNKAQQSYNSRGHAVINRSQPLSPENTEDLCQEIEKSRGYQALTITSIFEYQSSKGRK